MTSNIRVTVDKTPDLMKAIKALIKNEILVGIPDATAGRTPEDGEASAASNAQIGYVMEFGSPAQNIPERAFLVPGVRSIEAEITKRMKKAGADALSGNLQAVDKQFHSLGLIAQNAVRQKITDGPFAPLSPVTLAHRRARGRTGDRPLIDTGQLRRAITYILRERGKK